MVDVGDVGRDTVFDEEQRGDPARSDATRHLCVGAQRDPAFRRAVIEEVLNADQRVVSPSLGIDVVPILQHCVAARRRDRLHAAVQCLLYLALLVANTLGAVTLAAQLGGIWLVRQIVIHRRRRRAERPSGRVPASTVVRWLDAYLAVTILFAPTVAIGLSLMSGALSPLGAVSANTVIDRFWVFELILFASWAALAYTRYAEYREVNALRLGRFDPRRVDAGGPDVRYRIADIGSQQDEGNVTFYSQSNYKPFVGAGTPVRHWSFALELDPARPARDIPGAVLGHGGSTDGERRRDITPFDIAEIKEHVAASMRELAGEHTRPQERLNGLRIRDRAFASGLLAGRHPVWLPNPLNAPTTRIADAVMAAIVDDAGGAIRHYQCVEVGSWAEELVASVFLHYSLDGRMLYVEFNAYVLYPIRQAYHEADWLPDAASARMLGRTVVESGLEWWRRVSAAPIELASDGLTQLRRHQRRNDVRVAVRDGLPVDYGARTSIRELGAESSAHQFFQDQDWIKAIKIVERRLLAAMTVFLQSKGVNVEELRNQQIFITNHGPVQSGGSMQFHGPVAFGQNVQMGAPASGQPGTGSGGGVSAGPTPPGA